MANPTSLKSNKLGDVSADSLEAMINGMMEDLENKEFDEEDLRTNRSRAYNVESKFMRKPLVSDKVWKRLKDRYQQWSKSNKEMGTAFNVTFENIMLNVVPNVPEGYSGTTKISLADTGLTLSQQVIPDQEQTMELGAGPHVMYFNMHYSIPLNDDRPIVLQFETDCEMANSSMSVMTVFAYWKVSFNFRSTYYKPQRSTCTKLLVGYKKDTRMKDAKDVRAFVARSLVIERMLNDRPYVLPDSVNVVKEAFKKKEADGTTSAIPEKGEFVDPMLKLNSVARRKARESAGNMTLKDREKAAKEGMRTEEADQKVKPKADIQFGSVQQL
ncbi:37-kDa movement protein [Sorghum chlorotic spot virus]|uniref:37-kDa movement protein n=1 Tax=Sorghum chlorotic spot virus TaxID=107804 RepID=Q9JGJ5_9VIRU|nr:37-kDa movement protein [Sorghum chlorotic spot virus]BAA94804.1 37-kDa movement protein [Sorghum chlorotic spot virus]